MKFQRTTGRNIKDLLTISRHPAEEFEYKFQLLQMQTAIC